MSSKKKIFGGVLTALLALFAAVVVATPAVADEAAPLASEAGGYVLTNSTDDSVALTSSDYTYSGGTLEIKSTTNNITVAPNPNAAPGTVQGPINITGTKYVTLSGLNITADGTPLTIGSSTTANIVLDGNTTLSSTGSDSLVSIGTSTTVNLLGTGSLSGSTSASALSSSVTALGLNIGMATPTSSSELKAAPKGAFPATPTINLSSGSNSVISADTPESNAINLTIAAGSELVATNTADSVKAATVALGDAGTLTVLGTMTVSTTTAASSVAGVTTAGVTVGALATSGKGAKPAVPGSLTVDNAGTGAGITIAKSANDATFTVNAGSVDISTAGGAGINDAMTDSNADISGINLLGGETTINVANPTKAGTTSASAISASGAALAISKGTGVVAPASLTVAVTGGNSGGTNTAQAINVTSTTVGTIATADADAIEGTLTVDTALTPGVAGTVALNAGSVDVQAAANTAIVGATTVLGGTLNAEGAGNGNYALGSTLAVANGTGTASTVDELVGPTVTASVSGKATKAISGAVTTYTGSESGSQVSALSNADVFTYYWVAVNANSQTTPAVEPTVVAFAGQNGDQGGANAVNITSVVNGTSVEVKEAPVTSSEADVVEAVDSSAGLSNLTGCQAGFIVANNETQAMTASTANNSAVGAYVYNVVVKPTGFEGVSADIADDLALGGAITGIEVPSEGTPDPDTTVTFAPANNIAVSSSSNKIIYAPNDAQGATTTVTVDTEAYNETLTTPLTTLYEEIDPEPGVIPMVYQVAFNGVNSTVFTQNSGAPYGTSANVTTYLTSPKTAGQLVTTDFTDLEDLEDVEVLPTVSGNNFLSWYTLDEDDQPDAQVPQTQVSGYLTNTELEAAYATQAITLKGINPATVTVTNGGTATATVTATVSVPEGLPFDPTASGLNAGNWSISVPGGTPANYGLSVTPGAITGSDGTYTVTAIITAANNASTGRYTLNFTPAGGIATTNIHSATLIVAGARVTISGNGTVTQQVSTNGDVHLTATPNGTDQFLGWYGPNGNLISSSTSIDVPSGTEVTAKFTGQTPGPVPPQAGSVGATRLYNPNNGAHLMTIDDNEISALTTAGWRSEGVKFYVYAASGTNTVPVWRLYNPNNGDHLFTTQVSERDGLVQVGWKLDFSGNPIFYGAQSSNVPVYRVWNSAQTANGGLGSHLWTTDANEVQTLVNLYKWNNEGTAWFAVANGPEA